MKLPKDVVLSTKTFIISHIAILLSGLIFFGGLYYILYQEKFQPLPVSYNPVTKEPVSLFLEVASPDDEVLVYEDNIVVSGKTGPDATVIISNQDSDAGLQASKEGQFSKVFQLSPGPNILEITVFDSEGNSKTVTRSIYYSVEKLEVFMRNSKVLPVWGNFLLPKYEAGSYCAKDKPDE